MDESDPTPLATAWREIGEETGLTAKSVRLFRQVKPYAFADESIGREWIINPFSFVLLPESEGGIGETGIRLDWEHDGYKWFSPDQVSDDEAFGGVPRLLESFRRVWFNIDLGDEAGNALGLGLRTLQDDHESGARQLASTALSVFADVIEKIKPENKYEWWCNVRFAGWHLWKNGRESMGASVLSVVLDSLSIIESKLPSQDQLPQDFPSNIAQALKEYGDERHLSAQEISKQFTLFLSTKFSTTNPIKILTLSSSSTITSSLIETLSKTSMAIDLRILESRPLFEGASMAKKIATGRETVSSSKITIYTDASAAIASADIEILVLGADLIDRDGNVSNKVGSLPAVLSAKHISPSAEIVVLSEKDKILPYDPPGHEENDPKELTGAWTANVRDLVETPSSLEVEVKNVYFEWIARSLISHYITEDGVSKADDITKWAHERRKQADGFFDSL
mgnify:CR=1 FL=1